MSSIEELQQRVVQAEERFGLINAERAKYSERLMGLMDAIETRLGDQQAEIERQAEKIVSQAEELETLRRDAGENKPLRGMLQSLLNAIELGNSVALNETMQVLDAKISALIDADSNTAEAAPGDAEAPEAEPREIEAPEAEPREIEAAEAEIPEASPGEAEAPDIEAVETFEEESAAPEPEATEVAGPEPEVETAETEVPELEAAETASSEEDGSNLPEEEGAAPELEAIPEADIDEADELVAAGETQAAPESAFEPEAEAKTGVPEVLDIPASDADVTMIDEEMMIGAASDAAPPVADAVEENLVDEADAVLDVPTAADAGEQKSAASSLEDIMRRVSKLVEDEGALGPLAAGGVQIDASAPNPEAQSPEPAEAQRSASGG